MVVVVALVDQVPTLEVVAATRSTVQEVVQAPLLLTTAILEINMRGKRVVELTHTALGAEEVREQQVVGLVGMVLRDLGQAKPVMVEDRVVHTMRELVEQVERVVHRVVEAAVVEVGLQPAVRVEREDEEKY